jgi:putative transposase
MVRNSLKYDSYKDRKQVARDLKRIYTPLPLEEAEAELVVFSEKWDAKYGSISKM